MNKTIILISSLLLLQFPTIVLGTSANFLAKASSKQSYCQIEPERGEFLSTQQMQTLANQITVKVTGDNNGGSGTILAKQGNSYLVLTNFHVVRGVNNINLKTFDGKTYPAEIVAQSKFKKSDLALLKFQTNQNYCVAPVAESITNTTGLPVMATGYSAEKGEIVFRPGEVKQIPTQSLKEGYQIGYTSDIEQGMSGGAIINSMGVLIGINGRSAYPILNTGYVYENGKIPTDAEIEKMRKVSWGIPVSTVLAQVNRDIRTAYSLPLPDNKTTIATTQLTGWLGELEQKAKQFTVRIDSTSGGNGSGIIIAKQGDSYTVLTAAHVVCEKQPGTKPCKNYSYEILAADGKKYPVEKSTIKTEEGVDLGVLKFKSQQSYQVATLADYNPNTGDYIFTAGYPKLGNESPWRFTPGRIFDKEQGLLNIRQSDFQSNSDSKLQTASSLTGGYELVYTSITYGGMSGGPVLDSLGRVIGIHGRAEGEQAIDDKTGDCGANSGCKVQLGYSLGIPVSTFLGLTTRFGVQAQKVENKKAPQLTAQKVKSIQKAVLSANVSTGNAKAAQWLERGNQLWRLRRYKEVVEAFDEAIKQKPAFVYLAYYGKGLALGTQGKHKEAVAALEQAVKLKPDFVAAWNNLSAVYRTLEQPEKALVAIDKAIQLQPQNPNLYNEKYAILSDLKRYAKAEIAINKAIQLAERAAFYYNRGIIYAAQKKLKLALDDYNKAIQINPSLHNFYHNRGVIYANQKKRKLALADYNKAIQINPNSSTTYHNRGHLYDTQKKFDFALADYNKAIQINPNKAVTYNNRGIIYKNQKKLDLALADYNKAIQINPNLAQAYYNRGNVYNKQKKWDLALADYNKAIQIDPNDAKAYYNRGSFYDEQRKWDLALVDYSKAIEINPKYAIAYYNRAVLYDEQRKWDLALADYSKAIQINPNYVSAYYGRGIIYDEQKKWELAIADYSKAIQIDPKQAIAYVYRGDLYNKQKKWELALADYNKAIQINPKQAIAYYNRGLFYGKQKKLELAIADYSKAIQINPKYTSAYNNRGIIYKNQKKLDLALADYNKAIQINPKLARTYYNRGNVYSKQKKLDLALADYNKAIQLDPKDAKAYLNRGHFYDEQKKLDLALADYSKAIQLDPNLANAYRGRGNVYSKQKKLDLGIVDYSKAIQINPNDVSTYYGRGRIYDEQKKWDLALADYNKAIQINPKHAYAYGSRGLVYLQQGNKQKAIENLQQAAQLFQLQGNTTGYKLFMDLLKELQE